jgi:large subunit ribosomal protein L6
MYSIAIFNASNKYQISNFQKFVIKIKKNNKLINFITYNLLFFKKFQYVITNLNFFKKFSSTINSLRYNTNKRVYTSRFYLKGVGYKFLQSRKFPQILRVELGYSILAYLQIPKFVKIFHKRDKIIIISFYKDLLFNFSVKIFKIRPADPYKGKGVRITGTPYVTFKSGKQRLFLIFNKIILIEFL